MGNHYKHFVNKFLTLNKSEQRGIFVLVILILLGTVTNLLTPYFYENDKVDQSEFFRKVENFRQSQQYIADSIRIEKLQNRGELDYALASQKLKPFPFDPNRLPDLYLFFNFILYRASSKGPLFASPPQRIRRVGSEPAYRLPAGRQGRQVSRG